MFSSTNSDLEAMLTKILSKLKDGVHATKEDGTLDLPPVETCSLELLKRSDEQVPKTWKNIDVYPPVAKAIPAEPLDGILYRNRQRILDINEALGLSDSDFDTLLMPIIRNFASFVHLLPSSESHHHRGAGGALRHSLEVAFWSARAAEDILFCRNSDPVERRKIEPLWRVATCVAGLLHDAGKPIADVTVADESGEIWHPLQQPLYEYLRSKRRSGYYISWRGGRYKRHEAFTQRAFDKIVPSSFVSHLMAHDPNIMFAINDAFYTLDDSNHISKIVNWADQESVRRDAMEDVERRTGGDFDYGLPIHRHVFNSMRRLLQNGKWTVNQPGAKVWHGDEGTFVVFKHGLTEIISDIKKEVGVTIRNDSDGLVDEFIQRGLVCPRYVPGGEPQSEDELGEYYLYWVITPKILESAGGGDPIKLTAIKIDSADRLFRSEPPATADIRVWSTVELGGGFQPEFGSSRSIETVRGDDVNTETGEVVAAGQPEASGAIESEQPASLSDASPDVDQQNKAAPIDAVDMPFSDPEQALSSATTEDPEKAPENNPKQSLLHRAKTGFGGQKPQPKKQIADKVPEQKNEKAESTPNDVSSVLSSIDEDLDLPFGLSAEQGEKAGAENESDVPGANSQTKANVPDNETIPEVKEPGKAVESAEVEESKPSDISATNTDNEQQGDRDVVSTNKRQSKRVPKKTSASQAALNPLLSKKQGPSKKEPSSKPIPVKKMGKYKNIRKKSSETAPIYKAVDGDPVETFKQFVMDNSATGTGQIIETLVETVVTQGEQLGRRWFIENGSVAIAYPSAFEGITDSSADALSRLDKAKILKANPKQPMSKVMEVHDVMALVLDDRTSSIVGAYLKALEKTIDPLYVPPHPDLKVVKRAIVAGPDQKAAKQGRSKNKTAVKTERQSENSSNSARKKRGKGNTTVKHNAAKESRPNTSLPKEEGVSGRHQMAIEAMSELVEQMIAGEGDLIDEISIDGNDTSVPHAVVNTLKIRYPSLSQSLARQNFWKAAQKHGFGWDINKGTYTLRAKQS
ncbi:MobH family relaxase [Marinobacter sp. F3R08]|uniref:MobH family relaxase n=1 Tax=Marinobacter sp. F3R08 TaxID=2841559 RepID=UPI001C08D3B7|nr:MobH family relaxase [Marinobacter sp. F3R08]MBU2952229.1 TraI domain-containing protein [Marinobacter sp. F3R08]